MGVAISLVDFLLFAENWLRLQLVVVWVGEFLLLLVIAGLLERIISISSLQFIIIFIFKVDWAIFLMS
jgi:hypothetical protein